MIELAELAVIGLALGAVYALMGLGVSVIYRATRVGDFASVATGTVAALIHWDLTSPQGHLPEGLGYWPALMVSLGAAAALGILSERVLRPVADRPPLAMVAALAWGGALLAAGVLVFGTGARYLRPAWSGEALEIAGMSLPRQPLVVGGLALAAFLAAASFVRRSRFGVALRAVDLDRAAARAAGVDLLSLARRAWALGSVLQAAAIVLVLPPALSNPYSTLLFLPLAFGAALAGGFRRPGRIALGGLLLGVLPHLIAPSGTLGEVGGVQNVVAFLVILGILLTRPAGQSEAAFGGWVRASSAPLRGSRLVGLVALVVAAAAALVLPETALRAAAAALAISLVGASAVVVTGWSGQVSLAHGAFAGVGAFAAGSLVGRLDVPDVIAVPLALCAAVPLAVAVGLPSVRRRGSLSLAVASLGMVLAASSVIWEPRPAWSGGGAVATATGLESSAALAPTWSGMTAYLVALGLVAVAIWFAGNVARSRSGRALRAVGDSAEAAAVCGIDPGRARLTALALGGGLAAVGGILHVYVAGPLDPLALIVVSSLQLLLCAFVGGGPSLIGAVAVAFLLEVTGPSTVSGSGAPGALPLLLVCLVALGLARGFGWGGLPHVLGRRVIGNSLVVGSGHGN
ncbi:MAG: ABC transporter permease subunit [Acidimicrobiia bacterium]